MPSRAPGFEPGASAISPGRRSSPEGPRPSISSGSPPPRTAIPWPRLPLAVIAVAILRPLAVAAGPTRLALPSSSHQGTPGGT